MPAPLPTITTITTDAHRIVITLDRVIPDVLTEAYRAAAAAAVGDVLYDPANHRAARRATEEDRRCAW